MSKGTGKRMEIIYIRHNKVKCNSFYFRLKFEKRQRFHFHFTFLSSIVYVTCKECYIYHCMHENTRKQNDMFKTSKHFTISLNNTVYILYMYIIYCTKLVTIANTFIHNLMICIHFPTDL